MILKWYNRQVWELYNNVWSNLSAHIGPEREIIEALSYKHNMKKAEVKGYLNEAKWENVKGMDKDVLMVFTNGYINKKVEFIPNKIPFTTTQVDMDYKESIDTLEKNNAHKYMQEYIDWISNGDERKAKSLLAMGITLLTNRNEGLLGILYSKKGGTGKTQFLSLYKELSPRAVKSISTDTVFGHTGKFSLTGTTNKTGLIGDELPIHLNRGATDKIKSLIDKGKKYREFEDKGKDADETENLINMIITTNRISAWYEVDNALKTRVNVVHIKPDMTKPFSEDKLNALRENKDALQYLLLKSIEAYKEAIASKGFRASKFSFGLTESKEYWNKVSGEHNVINQFITFGDETILEMIEKKQDTITNSHFKSLFMDWKNESNSRISLAQMKKEFTKWGEENGYEIGTYRTSDERGIKITHSSEKIAEINAEKERENAMMEANAEYTAKLEAENVR